jgi:hypothetical protein
MKTFCLSFSVLNYPCSILLLALFHLGFIAPAAAEDKIPVVYIGSIPDQIHYFVPALPKALQLQIKSNQFSAPAYSIENAPAGCEISPAGLFRYTPAPDSNSSLEVNVKAVANGNSENQSFIILPTISVPDDVKCLNYVNSSFPPPETESKDYILVTENKSDVEEFFNTMDRKTRTASISGLTVAIQKGHENGLYERFCNYTEGVTELNADLKELTIAAEKIIIRGRVRFPRTKLSLFAKELVFEDEGEISTSPISFPSRAADYNPVTGTDAKDGHDGEDGGDIRLFVSNVVNPGSGILFFTSGSAGQDGGHGKAGASGLDKQTMASQPWNWPSRPYVFKDAEFPNFKANLNAGSVITYYKSMGSNYVEVLNYLRAHTTAAVFKPSMGGWNSCGAVKDWQPYDWKPGDGVDAIKAGAAGHGGKGGSLESGSKPYTSNSRGGGSGGLVQTPLPAGGKAGEPCPAFAMEGTNERSGCVFVYYGSRKIGSTYRDYSKIEEGIHFSKTGKDSPVPRQSLNGLYGKYFSDIGSKSMDWIHPLAGSQALKYVKAAYLNGRLDYAKTVADRWAGYSQKAIDEDVWYQYYSPSFDSGIHRREKQKRENKAKSEISQQSGEFKSVVSNINSGLDYYGNPAGWTPMISFELSIAAFRQQIDHSIDSMYLTYWLKKSSANNEKKLEGLWRLRNKTGEKVKESLDELKKLDIELPKLQNETEDTDKLEAETKSSLAALNNRLQMQAKDTVKNKRILGTVFKALGALTAVIPYGQPMLGQIGGSVGDIVSNAVNGDAAGAVDAGLGGLTKVFSNTSIKEKNRNLIKEFKDGDIKKYYEDSPLTPTEKFQWESKYKDKDPLGNYLNGIQTAGSGLATSIKSLSDATGQDAASDKDVQAEIKRLQEQSPEYKELGDKVSQLAEKKKDVVARLAQACSKIAFYSNQMTASLNAINSIQEQVILSQGAVSPNLDSYLDELSKRAEDNLVKYHYYMKKAYEYRMLQEYTTPLDLSALKDSIMKLVDVENAGHTLAPEQFKQLTTIYSDVIWNMCSKLYADIINMRKSLERDAETVYEFHQNQLDALNRGETLGMNFKETGLFGGEQGLRIRNIEVTEMNVALAPWAPSVKNANFSVFFTHDGVSDLSTAKGALYRFRHYNSTSGDNKIVYGAKYTSTTAGVSPIIPSVAEASLLKTILTDKGLPSSDADMPIFCWPSLNAKINISKSPENKESKSVIGKFSVNAFQASPVIDSALQAVTVTDAESSFIIKSLKVKIKYSMLIQDSAVCELTVKSDNGLSPTVLLGANDENGNGSGRAPFSRFFKKNTAVTITAPAQFGSAKFVKWTDSQGDSSGFFDHTNPTLKDLPMTGNRSIVARYSYDISGKIIGLTANGESTAGAAITVVGDKVSKIEYMEDSAKGTFTIRGLRPGKYTLTPSFNGNTFTPVSAVVEIVNSDVTDQVFNASPSAEAINFIIGKLRIKNGASWQPFGAAAVTLVRNDKSGFKAMTYSSVRDGTFQFEGLPPGNYTVTPSYSACQFKSSKGSAPDYTFDLSQSMVYSKSPNLIFNADEISACSVKGKVTGTGADGVKITVTAPNSGSQSAMTDKDGRFSFMLTPETYTFAPAKAGFAFTHASIRKVVAERNIDGVNFVINQAAPAKLAAPLLLASSSGLASISGHVENLASGETSIVRLHTVSEVVARTSTDGNGNFKFTGVAGGEYIVAPSAAGYKFRPWTKTVRTDAAATELVFKAIRIATENDFDGDGKSDILGTDEKGIFISSDSELLKSYSMASSPVEPAIPCEIIGSGDFDGDGICEVISRKSPASGPFMIYSPLRKDKRLLWHGLWSAIEIASIGDFNGDGISELVWFNRKTCEIRIDSALLGWDMAPKGQKMAFKNIEFLKACDTNGDGRDELVFKDLDSDIIYIAIIGKNGITGFSKLKD